MVAARLVVVVLGKVVKLASRRWHCALAVERCQLAPSRWRVGGVVGAPDPSDGESGMSSDDAGDSSANDVVGAVAALERGLDDSRIGDEQHGGGARHTR